MYALPAPAAMPSALGSSCLRPARRDLPLATCLLLQVDRIERHPEDSPPQCARAHRLPGRRPPADRDLPVVRQNAQFNLRSNPRRRKECAAAANALRIVFAESLWAGFRFGCARKSARGRRSAGSWDDTPRHRRDAPQEPQRVGAPELAQFSVLQYERRAADASRQAPSAPALRWRAPSLYAASRSAPAARRGWSRFAAASSGVNRVPAAW